MIEPLTSDTFHRARIVLKRVDGRFKPAVLLLFALDLRLKLENSFTSRLILPNEWTVPKGNAKDASREQKEHYQSAQFRPDAQINVHGPI